MEMAQEWFSELETEGQMFMIDDEMKNLYDTIDNISVDSFSSESYTENMRLLDQSIQTQHKETKHQDKSSSNTNKSFQTPEPLVATTRPSSNAFTISFANINPKNEILKFPDSVGYEAANTTKVIATARNNTQAQDHVLAERKRREKMNQHFISLSALLPNLKKMDKASVLEDASNYIKELQDRVKELEGLQSTKRKAVQECVISMKRSRINNSDDEYSSSDETDSRESTSPCKSSPEIEVRISGSSVLVRVHCQKNISSLVNILNKMQKLGLSIISSSAMPFAKTTILITIVAQIEDDFCMTTKELVTNLQLAM
ncbi:putative transcription factor bHLH family [Helianthus annuus]|uniref:Putative myc-type, basic helix-loop-helix (BHLH) domain-containing protein n=1 Tax=Helianthus annuus TaxID=4232 RepID=A0A251T7I3_HELAN|nr:transcription factor bHLH18 [Helianthus annuus]XP_035835401.1 transcription factor bHLH18 [Helianthus annuus]KAF5780226.1 putative transcription factor bHLH family [Helianthus annuus]KAJ0507412.1 putative transcription factor bHLH family [Helianthus annuus]KAJ0868898.1 putative transcription factor bHLH family [Helianthus annuus]